MLTQSIESRFPGKSLVLTESLTTRYDRTLLTSGRPSIFAGVNSIECLQLEDESTCRKGAPGKVPSVTQWMGDVRDIGTISETLNG